MKPNLFLTLIVFGLVAATIATQTESLSRSKRGITDFFRRLVGGRKKTPSYQQQQPVQAYGASSSNLYGGNGQEFLYGQSSSLHPMYQSSLAQQSEYVFPGISSSQSGPFAYGNFGSPNGGNNGQQGQFYYNNQPENQEQSNGYQPQGEGAHFQQYNQSPAHHHQHSGGYQQLPQQNQQSFYQNAGNPSQQQPFQSEESANNQAIAFEAPGQQQGSQIGGHSAVTADQDGIASNQFTQQQLMAAQSAQTPYTGNAPNSAGQQHPGFAASYNRPQYAYPGGGDPNQFSSRPYGSNPGTIDVHQVLDQFIRSAGLSPQGDHEAVKGDMHYESSNLKPALSVKKLISYPFYFSSSGDKPTSYGQSIRRQSTDETIFKTALNQNLLASQKMETPVPIESKMEPSTTYSQPANAPSDDEAQFIAKHAQALQEFLSKPNSPNSNSAAQSSHYYSPLTEAKDNKVTSSNGHTKA